ncbi:GNAT family N-acetyltransferase [Longispora sp. NPDC051575]|uniref:GNAT family N-acetyltransferase n=1 Tax=Longispora sp. NPDC051575 TaxID=3154943 RepID=UPI00342E4D10
MIPDLPIETDRLLLRAYAPGDVDDLYAFESLPEMHRYVYSVPRTRDQVATMVAERAGRTVLTAEGDFLGLVVELRETGTVIGTVVLKWASAEHRQGEIGYALHPAYHGKGLALEAATPLLRLGFEGLGLHRMYGRIDGRNTASAKLLERLGMRREAHLVQNEFVKGEWTDEMVYAVLASEWRSSS